MGRSLVLIGEVDPPMPTIQGKLSSSQLSREGAEIVLGDLGIGEGDEVRLGAVLARSVQLRVNPPESPRAETSSGKDSGLPRPSLMPWVDGKCRATVDEPEGWAISV